jgi:hypothetical protein
MAPQAQAVVQIPVDFEPIRRQIREAAAAMAVSVETMAQAVQQVGRVFARAHEVQVSGLEARVYVRAAMDPEYASAEALHRLVRLLIRKPHIALGMGDARFLHREDRFRLAAAAIRGWAEHRDTEQGEAMPWHRYLAGTQVLVS